MRRPLHLAQQVVHLGDIQPSPRTHRPVARHRRRDMVDFVFHHRRCAPFRHFVGQIRNHFFDCRVLQQCRYFPHHHPGAEILKHQPEFRQTLKFARERRFLRQRQIHNLRQQQQLRRQPLPCRHRRLEPLQHNPLVCRMLVNQNQRIFRLRQNIGIMKLRLGHAQRSRLVFRACCRLFHPHRKLALQLRQNPAAASAAFSKVPRKYCFFWNTIFAVYLPRIL